MILLYFDLKIRDKIFKINFLHDEKIFLIQIFVYDLELSYTFDLSHWEQPRRCTNTHNSRQTKNIQKNHTISRIPNEFSGCTLKEIGIVSFWLNCPQLWPNWSPREKTFFNENFLNHFFKPWSLWETLHGCQEARFSARKRRLRKKLFFPSAVPTYLGSMKYWWLPPVLMYNN